MSDVHEEMTDSDSPLDKLKHLTIKQKVIGSVVLLVVIMGVIHAKKNQSTGQGATGGSGGSGSPGVVDTPPVYSPPTWSKYVPPKTPSVPVSVTPVIPIAPYVPPFQSPPPITYTPPVVTLPAQPGAIYTPAPSIFTPPPITSIPVVTVSNPKPQVVTLTPDNQTAYLQNLVAQGGGNGEWAKAQLENAANTNQTNYLNNLIAVGGGNAEWAKAQLVISGTDNQTTYLNNLISQGGGNAEWAKAQLADTPTPAAPATNNQTSYLNNLVSQGGGNAEWAKAQLAGRTSWLTAPIAAPVTNNGVSTTQVSYSNGQPAQLSTVTPIVSDNQTTYLNNLVDAGGGNAEWAKEQLALDAVKQAAATKARMSYEQVAWAARNAEAERQAAIQIQQSNHPHQQYAEAAAIVTKTQAAFKQSAAAAYQESAANQNAYLNDLVSQGGGNAEWAKAQLETANQTAYLTDLVSQGGGNGVWAEQQLAHAAVPQVTNQQAYLQDLASQGGGNAEWANAQLAAGNY